MGFMCPICSDELEKVVAWPAGDKTPVPAIKSNIAATPCGHVFHTYCIRRWMHEGASSTNCPNCRKANPKKTSLPVFPNLAEGTSVADDSNFESEQEHYQMLAAELTKQKNLVTIESSKCKEKTQLYDMLSADFDKLNTALQQERNKNDVLSTKYHEARSFKTLLKAEQGKAAKLSEQIMEYSYLKLMLEGVEMECQQDMRELSDQRKGGGARKTQQPLSIEASIKVHHVLSQELKRANDKLNDEKKEKEALRKTNLTHMNSLKQAEKDLEKVFSWNEDLQKRLEESEAIRSSQAARDVEMPSCSKSVKGKARTEPKVVEKKKKRVFSNMDTTIEIHSSSESEQEGTDSFASPMALHVKSGIPGLSPLRPIKVSSKSTIKKPRSNINNRK